MCAVFYTYVYSCGLICIHYIPTPSLGNLLFALRLKYIMLSINILVGACIEMETRGRSCTKTGWFFKECVTRNGRNGYQLYTTCSCVNLIYVETIRNRLFLLKIVMVLTSFYVRKIQLVIINIYILYIWIFHLLELVFFLSLALAWN